MSLYDRYLAARTRYAGDPPRSVALVLTERDLLEQGAYDTLSEFLEWAFDADAERVAVYASVLDEAAVPTLRRELADVDAPRPLSVRGPGDDEPADTPIQLSVGLGGKAEFAGAVRRVASRVRAGEFSSDAIDHDTIEAELVFPWAPDLVIKTGAERLSDFMIWQSVYSELYFTDVNWRDFRQRDYLRAVRDYQERQRRFGR